MVNRIAKGRGFEYKVRDAFRKKGFNADRLQTERGTRGGKKDVPDVVAIRNDTFITRNPVLDIECHETNAVVNLKPWAKWQGAMSHCRKGNIPMLALHLSDRKSPATVTLKLDDFLELVK